MGRRREETHRGQRQPEATARNTSVTAPSVPVTDVIAARLRRRADTRASVKTRDRLLGYQATLHASCTPPPPTWPQIWQQMAAAFSTTCSIPFSSNPSERPRMSPSSPGRKSARPVAEQHPPPRAERTAGLVSVPFPTIRLQLGLAAHRASPKRFPTSGKKTTSLIGRLPEILHPRMEASHRRSSGK